MATTKSILEVPTLDIGTLMAAKNDAEVRATLTEDDPKLKHTIAELRKAAAEWGFFYIENHGVSEQQIEELRAASRAFFALPQSVKDEVRRNTDNSRGYYNSELTKNKPDWKEVFDFAEPTEETLARDERKNKWFDGDENQWLREEQLPGFRKTVTDYYATVEHIARRLVQVFAVTLGEEFDFFDQFFYRKGADGARTPDNTTIVRLNHYPVAPEPEKTMGVYHHTDAGAVTVLLQDDDVASLQVFHRGTQQWLNVPPKKNTFVINIGDMVQVWSNDKFVAPLHRVKATSVASRFSTPFFLFPSLEAEVKPIILGDNETPHYRPISWREYVVEKAKGNDADLGVELQLDHYRIAP